ncbi:MAG: ATP-binding protein [Proteobacteria bacterium]|nr:ATP-binding protein [Pseudomonadota bacterium]
MTTLTIHVPRLNDELWDAQQLVGIWQQVDGAGDGAEIIFNFTHCDFLRPNAVAFLGGLARVIGHRGGKARFLVPTMHGKVQTNLLQNGFAHAMGADIPAWQGNAIPYQEHLTQDKNKIIGSLKRDWLGRGWISVSAELANRIAGQTWEIFANAFEHSKTPVGVYSCGQYLPQRRELLLAVADFGVGIPSNVRIYLGCPEMPACDAMRWAFMKGHTTQLQQTFPRGMGLELLKDFVQKANGVMRVFSHDGHARIDHRGETYENLQPFFEGTLVQIRLLCDDKHYMLSNEPATMNAAPYF